MTRIQDFRDLTRATIKDVTFNQLLPSIREILQQRGDLPKEGIRYFLERTYGVSIGITSLSKALQLITNSKNSITFGWSEQHGCTMYSVPVLDKAGNPIKRNTLPVPNDWADGFYHIYMRYLAIRNNPELATMSGEYIDNLFNPQLVKDENAE